jgi:hypothetical protein
MLYLGEGHGILGTLDNSNVQITLHAEDEYRQYKDGSMVVEWNPSFDLLYDGSHKWNKVPPLALFLHELTHAADDVVGGIKSRADTEKWAMKAENRLRFAFFMKVPKSTKVYPRPGYFNNEPDLHWNAASAWYIHIRINHWSVSTRGL